MRPLFGATFQVGRDFHKNSPKVERQKELVQGFKTALAKNDMQQGQGYDDVGLTLKAWPNTHHYTSIAVGSPVCVGIRKDTVHVGEVSLRKLESPIAYADRVTKLAKKLADLCDKYPRNLMKTVLSNEQLSEYGQVNFDKSGLEKDSDFDHFKVIASTVTTSENQDKLRNHPGLKVDFSMDREEGKAIAATINYNGKYLKTLSQTRIRALGGIPGPRIRHSALGSGLIPLESVNGFANRVIREAVDLADLVDKTGKPNP
jgi:hypothetical protein